MSRTIVISSIALLLLSPAVSKAQLGELVDGFRKMINPPVTLPLEHPPKLWLNVEQVIFAETKGKCADEIAAILRQEFVQRGAKVIDRSHLDTVLQEHGLIKARLVEKETAVQLGKILGGTTLITLDVQRCEDEQNRWSKSHEKGSTYYAKSWTHVKGSAQVIDLETTQIFSAEVFQQDGGKTVSSSGGWPEYPPIFSIHDEIIRLSAMEVVKLLFRWEEGVEVPFFDTKKCGLKDAYRRVTVGDYDGAREIAEVAIGKCSGRKPDLQARALYDLGVIEFLGQNYESALENFERAYDLDPSKRTRRTVVETQRAIEVRGRLGGYESFLTTGNTKQDLAGFALEAAIEEAAATDAAESVKARLEALKELFDDGLISEEDYAKKRAEILKDL